MTVHIVDARRARSNSKSPFVDRALDPANVERWVVPRVREIVGDGARVSLREIRLSRHKPGRRCVVEYGFDVSDSARGRESIRVFGKARARGTDVHTQALVEELWRSGFRADGERAMGVPEPIGVVPELHMTLQRGAPGRVATELVGGPQGIELMGRVAETIAALHGAGVAPRRRHTIADELRILDERLNRVVRIRPRWGTRIERLMRACERIASRLDEPRPRGIHRDFYADQLIVDGPRLALLDLDLYALGDPALDVGNFVGHLTELSLRSRGDSEALRDREEALQDRYLELAGGGSRAAFSAYASLTLARHIHISTLFPDRRSITSDLLDLCEQRLSIARPGGIARLER